MLRTATKNDINCIIQLDNKTSRSKRGQKALSNYWLGALRISDILVETDERGQIRGVLYSDETSQNTREIVRIFTDPGERRKGVASCLLRYILQQAAEANQNTQLSVNKGNPDAMRLYKRFGFVAQKENNIGMVTMVAPPGTSSLSCT